MLSDRPFDGAGYLQPVARGGDFAEGNTCLHHAEWPGIHAEKHHPLPAAAKTVQIFLVRPPGVSERIVNLSDRRAKFQPFGLFAKVSRGGDERLAGAGKPQNAVTIF